MTASALRSPAISRRDFLERAGAVVIAASTGHPAMAAAGPPPFPRGPTPGIVQTVQGPIAAAQLGFTLPHEHVCASSAGFWQAWPEYFGGRAAFVARAVEKLRAAKREGIDSIVDVTTIDTGRDIRLIEEVSRKSGVQIVAGTGHWLEPTRSMAARSVEELTAFFTKEIEQGIEGTQIRAGVIKVATDREGVTPFLDKALRAAARASKATSTPIETHSFAVDRGGEKQAAIFEAEGLDPAMVCIGHSDESDDLDYLTGLARRGYTVGMDHLPIGIRGAISWQKRADCVKHLIDAGFAPKIFLSNDWYFGLSLGATGGMEMMDTMNPDGILFNTRHTIPYLKRNGVSDQAIRTITVDNPRRFFGGG
jgi:phosphotriesterase-related protein